MSRRDRRRHVLRLTQSVTASRAGDPAARYCGHMLASRSRGFGSAERSVTVLDGERVTDTAELRKGFSRRKPNAMCQSAIQTAVCVIGAYVRK